MKLLIATHNPGKLREFQQIFAGAPLQVVSLDDVSIGWEVQETGSTFEDNARLKALAYREASGLPTLADDSGLEVEALGGGPGVQSARYGGSGLTPQARYELVLDRMKDVPSGNRRAHFRCVIAVAWPGKPVLAVEGDCPGEITFEPRGSEGFGYDPIFFLPRYGCTMAELPPGEKNRISHRGRAAEAAKDLILKLLSGD